ncbi:MAG: 3-methyl-2-oxobutanoate hydroxymethyltransferase [Ruminococcus sp.]|nr:3-methyl-2-oxobutanoate hydroxymethyltransferase [Ruminococcus sp.]
MKQTVQTIREKKTQGERISMLTCYDYTTAKLMDEVNLDMILVGDSLGNVILGYEDTVSVTMEEMIHHAAAVARGTKNALLVVDMPFLSYQTSVSDAVKNAGRLMKEGRAKAVKLEGGEEVCPQIEAITKASIPVMGHLGMTPQSVNTLGGFKVQGKTLTAAKKLLADAKAVEDAGAFAVVLECVPERLATLITKQISIPTIGIGAGAGCDGQVLVYQDMLGMFKDYQPKFVQHFAQVGEAMQTAFQEYIQAVRNGNFPTEKQSYAISDDVMAQLEEELV